MFLAIRKRMEEREEGFTLIELLIVVIIIGILAAIAIPAFLNQRERARLSALQSDLRNAAVEVETFATNNNGTYTGVALPANFRTSPQVAVDSVQGDTDSYCIQMTHAGISDAANDTWQYDSDAAGGAQLLVGACAGA